MRRRRCQRGRWRQDKFHRQRRMANPPKQADGKVLSRIDCADILIHRASAVPLPPLGEGFDCRKVGQGLRTSDARPYGWCVAVSLVADADLSEFPRQRRGGKLASQDLRRPVPTGLCITALLVRDADERCSPLRVGGLPRGWSGMRTSDARPYGWRVAARLVADADAR